MLIVWRSNLTSSSSSFVLSREELIEWSGYRQRSKIAAWLVSNGVPHLTGRDGWPRVQRQGQVVSKTLTRSGPNVAALKELQSGKTKEVSTRSS